MDNQGGSPFDYPMHPEGCSIKYTLECFKANEYLYLVLMYTRACIGMILFIQLSQVSNLLSLKVKSEERRVKNANCTAYNSPLNEE